MATTYTITRNSQASYDFTINLDTAFSVATTIRWEIVPIAGAFPLALTAPVTGTVDFSTSDRSQTASPPITRNHRFPRDFEIRLYNDDTDALLSTSDEQSIAGNSAVASGDWILNGGVDKNVIGLGFTDSISATTGGAGNDTFIITRFQYGNVTIDDRNVNKSDPDSSLNVIKFDYGVTITGYNESSGVARGNRVYEFVELTLATGAVITIQSPNGLYNYQLGDGDVLDYLGFKAAIGVTPTDNSQTQNLTASDANYADELDGDYAVDIFTSDPILSRTPVEADTLLEMTGGSAEDILTIARDTALKMNGGGGNDVIIVSRFQSGNVTIDDRNGSENLIKFDYGVTITGYNESSGVARGNRVYEFVELTLATGAVITVLSPNGLYNYQLGDGEVLDYLAFKAAIGVTPTTASANLTPEDSAYADELLDSYEVPDPAPFDITGDPLRRDVDENIGDVALFTFKAVLKSDEGADVSYSITEGNGDGLFALVVEDGSDNAVISLAPNKNLNFETATSHKLTVQLSAMAAGATEAETQNVTITMNVKDINDEVPVLSVDTSGATAIAENAAGADTGIVFSVVDKDSVGTLTYDVAATTRNADNDEIAALFEVDVATGMLRLRERMALDREHDALKTSGEISLTITANDGRDTIGDSNFEAVTITVTDENDNAPMLGAPVWEGSFDAGVREDTATDTKIFGITATDDDADPTLTYKIVSINGTLLADITNPLFRIEPDNGDVKIANALDYETAPQTYSIVIQASDGTHPSNTAAVIVTVTDANDNPPQYVNVDDTALTTTATINERIAGNTDPIDVLTFRFTDEDTAGVNPAIMARYFTVLDANDVEDARFAVVADGAELETSAESHGGTGF